MLAASPTLARVLLGFIVFAAFGIEAAMGFGSTVLAVTLAAHLLPLEVLIPTMVSLNLVVSTYIVLRHRGDIAWRVLLARILPTVLFGMPAGMLLFGLGSQTSLKLGFGLFVAALAALELLRGTRGVEEKAPVPLSPAVGTIVLLGAGVVHGLYASGGPLVVYFSSRAIPQKGAFRATLSTLWLTLNLVLMGSFLVRGTYPGEALLDFAILLPALAAGILAGERLHGRIPQRAFRRIVFALLLAGGVVLALASLAGR
jgi:uncharacterized membrane protein YfcA